MKNISQKGSEQKPLVDWGRIVWIILSVIIYAIIIWVTWRCFHGKDWVGVAIFAAMFLWIGIGDIRRAREIRRLQRKIEELGKELEKKDITIKHALNSAEDA